MPCNVTAKHGENHSKAAALVHKWSNICVQARKWKVHHWDEMVQSTNAGILGKGGEVLDLLALLLFHVLLDPLQMDPVHIKLGSMIWHLAKLWVLSYMGKNIQSLHTEGAILTI